MNMRKWIISAVTLTFALGTAGAITAFAIAAGGGSDNPEVPDGGDIAGEVLHGDPTATSIDDIDPNVCNFIHNINACTPEELAEMGMAPVSASIGIDEPHPGTEVEGKPEPLFEDGEPEYNSTTQHECTLDQGVSVTSDGEAGCVDVIVLNDGEADHSQEQAPVVMPQVEPSAE